MRLQPVYLVEPEREASQLGSSRRALVLAMSLSAGIGFIAGSALARFLAAAPTPPRATLPPEDEALVQWAEQLQRESGAVLLRERATFLQVLVRFPEVAPRLRSGFRDLVMLALDAAAQTAELRQSLARELLQVLNQKEIDADGIVSDQELSALRSAAR